jgi:hypothetical protein
VQEIRIDRLVTVVAGVSAPNSTPSVCGLKPDGPFKAKTLGQNSPIM